MKNECWMVLFSNEKIFFAKSNTATHVHPTAADKERGGSVVSVVLHPIALTVWRVDYDYLSRFLFRQYVNFARQTRSSAHSQLMKNNHS